MGQYLAPSAHHYPVAKFLNPEEFAEYGRLAAALGFSAVLSEPLARSSYQAYRLYLAARKKKATCYA
jgi:lipoic acid synthetase